MLRKKEKSEKKKQLSDRSQTDATVRAFKEEENHLVVWDGYFFLFSQLFGCQSFVLPSISLGISRLKLQINLVQ